MIRITIDIPTASDKLHATELEKEKDQDMQSAILNELLLSPLRKMAISWSINERPRAQRVSYRAPSSFYTSVDSDD